jgi:RNA polymerase sigma-70 factor (ECF subfamily)
VGQQTHIEFSTTSWTLIQALQAGNDDGRIAAMQALVRQYWPTVYATLRRMGRSREVAAELTQAFFADVVLSRDIFGRADAQRGRLRTLLLTALKRYLIDQHRRSESRPDQDGLALAELEREESYLAREGERSPEEIYERRWAMAALEEATRRAERYFIDSGQHRHWAVFEAQVLRPSLAGASPPPLAELAERFGFASAVHVASATKVVRKRLRLLLREVTAETAVEPEDQEAEYRRVVELLGG